MNHLVDSCSAIHTDLAQALELIYTPNDLVMTEITREPESREYSACTFKLNQLNIKFRAAHTTPTKIGQFVTLWKRIGHSPIQPYDLSDPIDLFVISVRHDHHFGQFIFPKQALFEQGVISKDGTGGKRAIRVYPPWDITESRQAEKTQKWQCKYFLNLSESTIIDHAKVKKLYQ